MKSSYQDPKREIEIILCNVLWDKTGIKFRPNKSQEEIEPPYGVVICEQANPLVGGLAPRGYKCVVKVIYVTHMDEDYTSKHHQDVAAIEDGLMAIPQLDVNDYLLEENHIKVAGLHIDSLEESQLDQAFGDVFNLTVGAVGLDCPVTTS
jgi:hypothetical protein